MKTIQELAATTTSTSGISTVQGKVWLQEILKAAKKKMFFEQFAYVADMPKGNKDYAVPITTTNISFTTTTTESTTRTYTSITNVNTVVFTPTTQKLGARISKKAIDTSQVDLLAHIRDQLAYDAALKLDQAFVTAINASTPATTLYGGDATNTTTLADGDILTTDLVAKGQRYLKANGWYSEPDKPFVLFIPAVCEEAFLKDSQFVNAAEYGGNQVIANGEIGSYLGIRIVVSEQCTAATNWGGASVSGHSAYLLKARVAYGIVYGQRPTLDFEYKKDEAEYRVYLDMDFMADTLQDGAIVIIKVTDV